MKGLALTAHAMAALLALGGCAARTPENANPALAQCRDAVAKATGADDLVWIPGGRTVLGSERFQPEERPLRTAEVDGFWIDRHEVTNAEFAAFVRATGYRTFAERDGNGAAVFRAPERTDGSDDLRQWWTLDPKASWRRPLGGRSDIKGRDAYPVVGVTYADALAYARWKGRDLPTEAEWERAARGGLEHAEYVWGDEARHGGRELANHWQGVFPTADAGSDGFKGLAPVACFPPNGYGLYDMAGNVWEIVKDRWPAEIAGAPPDAHVIKGGSYLCSDDYCLRYRPAARQPGDPTLGSSHIGFRTVWRGPPPTPERS